ncbi:hypothetical protein FNAPI_9690 [Fusarium napiforme]|uniref:Uncharacterized protein n=1 Tax=Fusarium napiforme TaxID=42672 RepID=A0A8H5MWK6_9HYPO|nr:hypothetical protein FNAPI_9690 [Fusarium napiforme]
MLDTDRLCLSTSSTTCNCSHKRHSGVQYTEPPVKSTTAAADAVGNARGPRQTKHGKPVEDIQAGFDTTRGPKIGNNLAAWMNLFNQTPKALMASPENNIGNRGEPHASGTSDVLRLSKEAFVRKAAIEAGKYWDEMHARDATAFG